jgi:hypothetical protein
MGDPGHIHMNGQQVAPILDGLRTDAQELATGWGAASGELTGHEAGIGTGPLGAKFAALYNPLATHVRTKAGEVPVELATSVDVGYEVLAEYIATDQLVANSFVHDDTYATGI